MQGIPLSTMLELYGELVDRTILATLNLPKVTFDYKINNDLTYQEAQAFYETLLSQRGITVIPLGEKFVQVIPSADVTKTPPKFTAMTREELPEGQIYIIKTVQLQYALPSEMADVLNSYAKSPNAVQAIDSTMTLVLRDYSSNVKRMLELIELVDVELPDLLQVKYKVLPVKYEDAYNIANLLASLSNPAQGSAHQIQRTGTSGGGTTSRGTTSGRTGSTFGGTGTTSRTSGSTNFRRFSEDVQPWTSSSSSRGSSSSSRGSSSSSRGSSSLNSLNQRSPSGGSLQQRLGAIRGGSNQAGQAGQAAPILGGLQVILAGDKNEIVVVGTKDEIDKAAALVAEIDVIQPQVLIEAVIIDVALGDDKTFGSSLRQQKNVVGREPIESTDLSSALASALGPAAFTPTTIQDAATGFNYYGFLGSTWEVALNAIKNDSAVEMLSRPRIQTQHGQLATLFIGERRPVVTGTITDISGGSSSNYQLQQIGITMTILPYINKEGLVVMDISQQIQDIVGSQTINGNPVPIFTDRQAEAKVAVRDGEMIVLGGFVKSKTTSTKAGVPILQDIPLLGKLFQNGFDSDERSELIVLIRPTVLETPEAAHAKALETSKGLPGIDGARLNEQYLEEKYRQLQDVKKNQRESRIQELKKSLDDKNEGKPNGQLIPPLPKDL